VKILLVVRQLALGGTERRMVDLGRALVDRAEVRVLALEEGVLQTVEDAAVSLSGPRTSRLARMAMRVGALRRAIASFQPDVVHGFDGESTYYARFVQLLGGHRFMLIGGFGSGRMPTGRLRTLMRSRLFDPAVFVCNSEAGGHVIEVATSGRVPVFVIPNGIDARRTAVSTTEVPPWFGSGRPVVGYMGKLDHIKFGARMVDVAERLKDHPARPVFAVYGDGPDLEGARRRVAADPRLAESVFLMGASPDAAGHARNFTVGVLCSDSEGFPNVLLEFMSLGVPCVSTGVGDAPRALDRGRAGEIVPAGDIESLAAAVRKLLDDPARRTVLAERGRARVKEHYSLDRMAGSHWRLYTDLVRDGRPSSEVAAGLRGETESRAKRLLIVSQSFPNRTYPIHSEFLLAFAKQASTVGYEVKVLTVRFSDRDLPLDWMGPVEVERFPFHLPTYQLLRGLGPKIWYLIKFATVGTIHMRRVLRQFRPDVVDFEFIVPPGVLYFTTRDIFRRQGIKRLVRVNGSDLLDVRRNPIGRMLLAALYRQFSVIHYINTAYAEYLLADGLPASRIKFSSHGLEAGGFRPDMTLRERTRERLGLRDRYVLLNVARMVPLKMQYQAVEALPAVLAAIPHALLVFAGDGPSRKDLEALASTLGVSDHVRFLGAASPEELVGIYNAGDLFVFPIVDELFAAYTVLEAAACGLPVVTNFRPEYLADYGLREGRDLVRFRYMDSGDLAAQVIEAHALGARTAQMADSFRAIVHERLDAARCAREFLEQAE
jgi:GalNAc-alpha-(1->4)-GalNAc-alpha-(1->3)-diNAcBac-PP-undecaprenol alpha-1,4-N-acetyl-D-galactosaminyltransferase